MGILKYFVGKVKNSIILSLSVSFFVGILVATIPNILTYEWQMNDIEERNKPCPSVQLIDANLSFAINDKVTYHSEEFKIPEFLFEEVTGNPYIYPLPKLSQSIPYKDLRNYFITSHNFNKEHPIYIESMMTKYKKIYSFLEAKRNIKPDEIDNFFLYFTTYGNRIFHEFSNFINYNTDTEIEEYFKKSKLFSIIKDEVFDKNKPHEINTNIKEQLINRHKYFKHFDFINEDKIGWKISSDNIARSSTVTYGNYKLDKDRIKYLKFYVYSIVYYDKDSLKLIFDLLYKEYSDVDKIRKIILHSQSVNNDTMKYFSRFKVSLLYLNKGKTPITFMPNSTLIIENPSIFEYEYFDGTGYIKKAFPDEIRIQLAYYESFNTIAPFRLEENEGKIITMISQKQIKDMIDYQGILKAFATGSLKCRIEGFSIESKSVMTSNKIDFRASNTNED